MSKSQFDSTLASVAIYEQAHAHLEKKGEPITDFLTTRLAWMYNEVTPFLRKFVSKELGILV